MAIALSTAGVKIGYGVETTAGTEPTSYTDIGGIKSISDLNPQPNQLDCTPLSELEYKQYIDGLKDISGVITLGANNTNEFQTAWAALVTAASTARSGGKATWFSITIPNMTNAFKFKGIPSPLGLSGIEVDSVLSIDAYITPTQIVGWGT